MTESEMTALAGLFSSTVVRELARHGRSQAFARLARESGIETQLAPSSCLGTVFDAALDVLRRERGGEYVFKAAIAKNVLMGRHSLNTAAMLTEVRVGDCKADVVLVNGTSTAYEIKSDRDRLDRLESQVATYLRAFASVNVITSDRHAPAVLRDTPEEVGVMRLTRRGHISTLRKAVDDPGRIDPCTLFSALPLSESKRILFTLGHSIPDVPNTRIRAELARKFASLEPASAHAAMVDVLRSTRSHRALASLLLAVPRSLQAATLGTRLRQVDRDRLLRALDTQLLDALRWG